MGVVEGSCTLYVPRKAAFQQQQGSTSKPSYIKYGIFTVGGHDWEIQVYPNGSGTVALHLCLLSDTAAEVTRTEIWTKPDYSDLEIDYADNIHKPNIPKEIDSVTVAPSDKNDCVTIKVVLSVFGTDKPAKPNNEWNPDNADISFDGSNTKPISNKPAESQWNPSNANVSFDSSNTSGSLTAKPDKPSAAWDPSKADISFDSSNTKPISNKPAEPQWNPSNADVSFDSSNTSGFLTAKPDKPSAAWDPSSADISFDNTKSS